MKNKLLLTLAVALLTTTSMTSCSWFSDDKESEEIDAEALSKTDAELYSEGRAFMDAGRYQKAVASFQEIERIYPFSSLANKAKVNEAISNYYDEEYDKAIDVIDQFVSMNPGNAEVEFMYYLKAICYYDRITDVKRDQEVTVRALKSFEELRGRFPDGRYARDAQYKIDLIRDHLAAKDMEVGRFYLKNKNYIASINRFQSVVKEYDDTAQIEEALYRLVEANMLLGIDSEAMKYGTILGYNYPSTKWYKRAYALLQEGKVGGKERKTFVGKMIDTVGLGDEPESTEPAALSSSPNIVDTGGWLTDGEAPTTAPTVDAPAVAPEGYDSNNAGAPTPAEQVQPVSDSSTAIHPTDPATGGKPTPATEPASNPSLPASMQN